MPELSRDQFEQLARDIMPHGKESGGFTVNPRTGERVGEGWAVSLAGAEHSEPLEGLTPEKIKQYHDEHRATLRQPGVHLGGYGPAEGELRHGTGQIDHSQVTGSKKRAIRTMLEEDQDSAYDLGTGEMVHNLFRDTTKIPNVTPGVDRAKASRGIAENMRKAVGKSSIAAQEAEFSKRNSRV